jgi:guanine deaminase
MSETLVLLNFKQGYLMKILLTNIINPKSDKKADLILNGAICIKNGKILNVGDGFSILKKYEKYNPEIINLSHRLCLPSFFDMHFHWVQDDVRLMPKDSLLEWLSKYTWPYEAKFKSINYTKEKAQQFARELLQVGTLGGACYASIHPHTVDVAQEMFIGDFIIGNVLMTMNSPDYLTQTSENALRLVSDLSGKYTKKYAMTPRFAPTVDPETMKKASSIAFKNKSFIQTHLSETEDEIKYVLSLYKKLKGFEKVKSYTEIYEKTKILSAKTIMGHGIYLSDEELKKLKKTKTMICHCPTSNAPVEQLGLGSGLFNFKKIEKNKIPWALGSDIGGGPYLSMIDVMRSFVLQNQKKKIKEATFTKALYRSTLAGAHLIGLHKTNGSIDKTKYANLIFLEFPKTKSTNVETILKLIMMKNAKDRKRDDHLITETYYKGNCVFKA